MRAAMTIVVLTVAACGSTFVPSGDVGTDVPPDVLDTGADTPGDTIPDTTVDTVLDTAVDVHLDTLLDEIADTTTDVDECDGACTSPLLCCDGRCVNPNHDPEHCGGCDAACPASPPYCEWGTCGTPPCSGTACIGIEFCCGSECCTYEQTCCIVEGGPLGPPGCIDGPCPPGCPWCP